jgi:hypothetical protein
MYRRVCREDFLEAAFEQHLHLGFRYSEYDAALPMLGDENGRLRFGRFVGERLGLDSRVWTSLKSATALLLDWSVRSRRRKRFLPTLK